MAYRGRGVQRHAGMTAVDLPTAELARLFDLWNGKRGDRPMPARGDFEVSELKDWLGNLMLIEVERDSGSLDFRYRVYGTVLAEWFGRDLTRKSDAALRDDARATVRDEYERVCRKGEPLLTLHDRHLGRRRARMAKLVLPLSDNGDTVDRLLAAAYPLG